MRNQSQGDNARIRDLMRPLYMAILDMIETSH